MTTEAIIMDMYPGITSAQQREAAALMRTLRDIRELPVATYSPRPRKES